jgi:hypothetical protein
MITFLMSTVGRYLIGGALIASLVGGGYFYISHLRHKVKALETQNQQLERAKKIYEQDRKTDENIKSNQDRIDSLPAGDLGYEFDRLRQRSTGEGGKSGQAED